MIPGVLVLPTPAEVFDAAARRFVAAVGEALTARGVAHVALAGGSTPAGLYERLATPEHAARVDWRKVHVWWGDERAVPPDDPASNYRMARDILLSRVPVEPAQVHRMAADPNALDASALRYEKELDVALAAGPAGRLDLVLLGVGEDGHTASLFPNAPALAVRDRRVVAVTGAPNWPRLTLTLPVLNGARHVHVLATGAAKARAVSRALVDAPGNDCPAGLVRPDDGQLLWLIDAEADQLRSVGGKGGPRDARIDTPGGPRRRSGPAADDHDGPLGLPGEIELE
jgi:6-phosphogluconolactonase